MPNVKHAVKDDQNVQDAEEQSLVQYTEACVEESEQRTVQAARYVANKVRLQKQQREKTPPAARNMETMKPVKKTKKARRAVQSIAQSA